MRIKTQFTRRSPREGRKKEDEKNPGPKSFESYKA
jgi:hypothetical protein